MEDAKLSFDVLGACMGLQKDIMYLRDRVAKLEAEQKVLVATMKAYAKEKGITWS